jgi:cell division protein FtsQ
MSRFLVVLIIVVLSGLVAWTLFRSPLFSIRHLDVSGAVRADPTAALSAAGVAVGQPMVTADLTAAAERLLTDPWIAGAAIERDWPDRITVELVEREVVGTVECATATVVAAVDGTVLPNVDPATESVGRIVAPSLPCESLATDRGAAMALQFLAELPPRIARGITVTDGAEGLVATTDRYVIRLGSADRGTEKARALVAVLNDPPEPGSVITLIAPNRPAVLPPQVTTASTVTDTSQP